MPDIPTLQESGLKEFDLGTWYGMWYPAGTPREIVLKAHADIAKIQALPEMQRRFEEIGLVATATPPDEFAQFVARQVAFYQSVVKRIGMPLQ